MGAKIKWKSNERLAAPPLPPVSVVVVPRDRNCNEVLRRIGYGHGGCDYGAATCKKETEIWLDVWDDNRIRSDEWRYLHKN